MYQYNDPSILKHYTQIEALLLQPLTTSLYIHVYVKDSQNI